MMNVMDPFDWRYVGEGGKHVIFVNDKSAKVLRLSKDLNYNQHTPSSTSSTATPPSSSPLHRPCQILSVPLLQRFMDPPEIIDLSKDFIESLFHQAIPFIPPSRIKSWSSFNRLTQSNYTGTLMSDYRRVHPRFGMHYSVEIKPKAGYITQSPLVHPLHRAKFRHTRFRILQNLAMAGKMSKGWLSNDTTLTEISTYDPIQLFSGNVLQSLQQLMRHPQNNLKIWVGTQMTVGPHMPADPQPPHYDAIIEAVAIIDEKEQIFQNLLLYQKTDLLDADGAVLVYQRLVNLLGGDAQRAETLIDETSPHWHPHSNSHSLLPDDAKTLLAFIESFSPHGLDTPQLDEAFRKGVHLVGLLTKQSCISLLQMWLFSLAMCDVSLIIALHPHDQEEEEEEEDRTDNNDNANNAMGIIRLAQTQTQNAPTMFKYTAKIVDCDQKPAKKLRSRWKKEQLVRLYSDL